MALTGAVCAVITIGAARGHETELIASQFRADASERVSEVQDRVQQNLYVLRTFGALYACAKEVDRREFRHFAAIQLGVNPSLRSIAWVPRVPASERERHVEAIRAEGFADYDLFQRDGAGQRIAVAPRDAHYPLAYIEPEAALRPCFGFDLASSPERVQAMERSIEQGVGIITGRIDAHATGPHRVEIAAAILPVANDGRSMSTVDERRAHSGGFVQVDFYAADVVGVPTEQPDIRLSLYDVTASGATRMLVEPAGASELEHAPSYEATITAADQRWLLRARATDDYVRSRRTARPWIWAAIVALLGMGAGALPGWIRGQTHRVEVQVAQRTADLAQSEARYRAVFDDASDLIVSVTADGRIELANRAWAVTLGDPALPGRGDLHDLVPPDRRAELDGRVAALFQHDGTRELSLALVDLEGRHLDLEGHARVRRRGTQPIAFQAILRNVTERHRLEKILAQREESLREGNKMHAVSQLAGGLAHEFNNLLTTISGFAQFLAESLAGSPDMKQDVDEILVAAERGSQLTRQLLMFTDQQPSKPEALELNARLTLLVPTLRLLTGRGVQLALDLDPLEPRVKIDRSQFEQVIINLVSNARDALPGGGTLEISTRVEVHNNPLSVTTGVLDPGRYAVIRVRDTGEGIAPEAMKRVFEPFFTTRTERHAPGLGLSIAYRVLSEAGGGIAIASTPGEGTCVSLYLPRTTSTTTDKIARMTTISGAMVLLAEDEAQVRQMTARILRQTNFQVIEAADGLEALAVLESRAAEIGLLVTDVIMPNLGGAELARRAKAIDAGLPVIFVSGYTAQGLSEHGSLPSDCELIHKPFSAELFIEKVREKARAVARAIPDQADAKQ